MTDEEFEALDPATKLVIRQIEQGMQMNRNHQREARAWEEWFKAEKEHNGDQ